MVKVKYILGSVAAMAVLSLASCASTGDASSCCGKDGKCCSSKAASKTACGCAAGACTCAAAK